MNRARIAKTVLTLLTAAAIGFSGPALGNYVEEIEVKGKAVNDGKSIRVSFGDLNTSSEEGAEALYRRLQHASRLVCDVDGSQKTRLVEMTAAAKRCYEDLLDDSVRKVNKEMVTQIHEGK